MKHLRLWPKRRRRRRSPGRPAPLGRAAAAAFAAAVLVLTAGWLWGQAAVLRQELSRAREAERRLATRSEADVEMLRQSVRRERDLESALGEQRAQIDTLRAASQREPSVLRRRMISPTVRIEMPESVGSGTVIRVEPAGEGAHSAYILTACHVIEEALEAADAPRIDIELFNDQGEVERKAVAEVLLSDRPKDLALLRARIEGAPPAVAELATLGFLETLRTFDPVYVVGCPLGFAPLPSKGEITHQHRRVDGQLFWMTDAQMIFGNSGGGVYDERTQRLVGVSIRVCAYGRLVPAAVPHLGLMVPLTTVHAWLREQGQASVLGEPDGPAPSAIASSTTPDPLPAAGR